MYRTGSIKVSEIRRRLIFFQGPKKQANFSQFLATLTTPTDLEKRGEEGARLMDQFYISRAPDNGLSR